MPKTIQELIPAYIRNVEAYIPGKPIEEVERELGVFAVKLASNENPLGPSPLAMAAIQRTLGDSHRYPDGGCYYLREKLAAMYGVRMDEVLIGLGSSELIDLSARLLLHPGDEGLTSEGTFPLYYISIQASGAREVRAPLRNYGFDLDALAAAITPKTRYIILSNPNNPTGTMFTAGEFDRFLAKVPPDVLVVVDEAYCDYVGRDDYSRSIELVRKGRLLLVLRTFSKIYGLAGIRVGYGIGPVALLAEMDKIRTPFNTAGVSQAAALAALDDAEHVRRSLESNRAGMHQLGEGLDRLGVKFVPSFANFILVDFGRVARPFADEMLKLGVIVRPVDWMGFPNCLRVTIGTREENDKFLIALARVLHLHAGIDQSEKVTP